MLNVDYGFTRTFPKTSLTVARERITAALAKEGFGIITEIDIAATMKKKLNVEFMPYLILGACNPQIAHQALSLEPGVGLVLPCNVVVAEQAGDSYVSIIKPEAMFSIIQRSDVAGLVQEVTTRLTRALAAA